MGKIVELQDLYKETVEEISKNEDNWLDFLKTASWNFKYSFQDQVLIYLQRPDATACADINTWNSRIKRWVNKNSKGIFVTANEDSKYPYRLVFDVSDTHNYKNTKYNLWEYKDKHKEKVIETLESKYGDLNGIEDISKAINLSVYNMVDDNLQDYLELINENKIGTKLEKYSKDDIKIMLIPTLWASVFYMINNRCGLNNEIIDRNEFTYVNNFNDSRITTILGTAASEIAEDALREISKTIITLNREEKNKKRTFEKNEEKLYYNNKEIENKEVKNNENIRIQESGRLSNSSNTNGERTNASRKIRSDEIEISKGEQKSSVYNALDGQNIKETLDGNTRNSNRNDREYNQTNGTERWNKRENENGKSDEVGRTDEQLQDDSRRTSDTRIDLQLDVPTEQEQKTLIAEVENTPAFSFTQKMIDDVLLEGSGFQNGKFRIYDYLTKSLSNKENADYLKQEYGIGGRSGDDNGVYLWHDAKGIKLSDGFNSNTTQKTLTWLEVEKGIRKLISDNRYLNEKEFAEYKKWKNKDIEITNITQIREKTEDDYYFQIGDKVFIGLKEYQITSITNKQVTLADIEFPIMQEVLEYSSFIKKIMENPYNEHLLKENRNDNEILKKDESLEEKLLKFENEYDIFDVDEITKEDIYKQTLNEKEITNTIEYLKEIQKLNNGKEDIDFSNKLNEILLELNDRLEKFKIINSKVSLNKEENNVIPKVKTKKRNKIEYFDLFPEIPINDRNNYKINDNQLGYGTKKEKFNNNINAIKTLKKCQNEKRYASKEEQEILSKYVGWGGIPEAFDNKNSNWTEENIILKDILTEKEYEEARQSSLTAFYTPPVVISSIYKALENMGLEKGNILEPSCGVGNFFGMIPDKLNQCKLYGIELDTISGNIARQLYQKNTIAVKGFEEVELPDSFFDVAVGNVPFGDFKITDRKYDKNNFLIHDYFFAKTLDKVRPNGVIAFITSKGTMDKKNDKVRRYISQRAELIGAIRLPNNTFKSNAGTEVTSDILFLKKRDKITDIVEDWVNLDRNEDNITMNSYFVKNPNMILGKMQMQTSQFGMESTCVEDGNISLEEKLNEAILNLNAEIEEFQIDEIEEEENAVPATPNVKNFSYTIFEEQVYYRENSLMYQKELPLTQINRIKGMIELRDSVRRLIELQTDDASDYEIKLEQENLNILYDKFVRKYGRINDKSNERAFNEDSSYFLLTSLEVLDEHSKFIRKADMFTKRTIRPNKEITKVDSSLDALILSIAQKANVDLDYMISITDKTKEELITDLKGSIYFDPNLNKYVTADEYLSGNVREKLNLAKELAEKEEKYNENVVALEKVKIKDLSASEISVRLGATWIPKKDIQDFVYELLDTPIYRRYDIKVNYSDYNSEWSITGKNQDYDNIKANNTYGTKRMNAYKIIESTLNLKDVRVYDNKIDYDGNTIRELNSKETAIAQAKQEQIKEEFENWIWKDQKRRERLVNKYNELYNSIKPREYDGKYIEFGGMNPEITLRKHQVDAIARILYGGNTLLAHEVGAGKTFEMVAAAMESKRLGLCNKSLFVVPNHIIEQFASEFMQLYPAANILVATKKDFATNNRKRFCSKIATGEYDAIILGHSQFEKIPLSKERQEELLKNQINTLILGIENLKENRGENFTIKQLEKSKKRLEEKLKKLNDQSKKDDVLTFEELGVDRLFVDEAHYFKNLFLYTKMRNVSRNCTNRSTKVF